MPPLGAHTPPYPTLIEYSGYGYADPSGPTNGIAAIANVMGFAVVDIQMRGTGCSGGAFDFFEPLQSLDGYDIVETVARQPWVKGGKVGMMGISYGGISQLFTAQLRPPQPRRDLAAVGDRRDRDDALPRRQPQHRLRRGLGQGAPGAGPARRHRRRGHPAVRRAAGRRRRRRRATPTRRCTARPRDLIGEDPATTATTDPKVADPLDPVSFVHKINVPTFMACQFQDEQTGGHCPALVPPLHRHRQEVVHLHQRRPHRLARPRDAEPAVRLPPRSTSPTRRRRMNSAAIQAAAPVIYQAAMGMPAGRPDHAAARPGAAQPTYDGRWRRSRRPEPVRVLFDNGAGTSPTGDPAARRPLPRLRAVLRHAARARRPGQSWYLGAGERAARARRPAKQHVDRYRSDPRVLPGTDFDGVTGTGGLWGNASQWNWDWKQRAAGTAVSYVSAAADRRTSPRSAPARCSSGCAPRRRDVDFQATVSEVRDGHETFVQSGWMRGSERKLATGTATTS